MVIADAARRFSNASLLANDMDADFDLTKPDRSLRTSHLGDTGDHILDAFDAAWGSGKQPQIDDYVSLVAPENRDRILRELVEIDIERRRSIGFITDWKEYGQRFPELLIGPAAEEAAGRSPSAVASTIILGDAGDGVAHRPVGDGSGPGASVASQFGKFQLLTTCGNGAFGTVYRAVDTSIDRVVALKVPRAGRLISPDDEDRFLKEAKAVASLRGEQIVPVYEAGRIDGVPYIAAEFVEGHTLEDLLKERQLSKREAADIAYQISLALAIAHQQGVIHRDVKPANVMVNLANQATTNQLNGVSDDSPFRVRLMDFGLARSLVGISATLDGEILGTPAYMSPEQAAGNSRHVDGRSDVFGLGVLFYQVLTGALPFPGTNVRNVLQQILECDPRSPCQLDDTVPLDLQTICLKCLEKDPASRYQSASLLSEDLYRYLHGFPIKARPTGMAEKAFKWCRRHRLVAALSGAVFLALVGGIAGTTWQLLATLRAEETRTQSQIDLLYNGPAEIVPALLDQLEQYSHSVDGEVQSRLSESDITAVHRGRSLLYLNRRGHPVQKDLFDLMTQARFSEAKLIADELTANSGDVIEQAQKLLASFDSDPRSALRTAYLMSQTSSDLRSAVAKQSPQIADAIIREAIQHTDEYRPLESAFQVLKVGLVPCFEETFANQSASESERRLATSLLCTYYSDDAAALSKLILRADDWQLRLVLERIAPTQSAAVSADLVKSSKRSDPNETKFSLSPREIANACLAHLRWGERDLARKHLLTSTNREARSYFIARFKAAGLPPRLAIDWLNAESDPFVQAMLVLVLGEFDREALPDQTQTKQLQTLIEQCREPGLFSAIVRAAQGRQASAASTIATAHEWLKMARMRALSRGPNGHVLITMRAARPQQALLMSSPGSSKESSRPGSESYGFALSMFETTISQYREFDPAWTGSDQLTQGHDSPVYSVSPQKAAEYCNWLSRKDQLSEDQWCYVPSRGTEGQLESAPNVTQRTGYRLPTELEWELACRNGTSTKWFFGDSQELLFRYAWCPVNCPQGQKHPVGRLMPNDAGFFDLYGNADEITDLGDRGKYPIRPNDYFITKGGAAGDLISPGSAGGNKGWNDPLNENTWAVGFRICRTLAADEPRESDR
jgi:hypothetical protein